MKHAFSWLVTAALAMAAEPCSAAGPRDDAAAAVSVYEIPEANGVAYVYTVTNVGSSPIVDIAVGYDYYSSNPELTGALPTSILGPSGWSGQIVTEEESAAYEIHWRTDTAPLMPGATLTGLRVVAPVNDPLLYSTHWTVVLAGPPTYASSTLVLVPTPVDITPPLLGVVLSPTIIPPARGKLTPITATLSLSDDSDANPTVWLESVTCNDCPAEAIQAVTGVDTRSFALRAGLSHDLPRIYTVTYKAQDAAGNVATTTAQVTVKRNP